MSITPRKTDGTFFGFDEHHITEGDHNGEFQEWLEKVAPDWTRRKEYDPDGWAVQRDGSAMPPRFHVTHWIGEQTVQAIQNHDTSQPMFLWSSFIDPHHPFNAPKKYVDMYRGREVPKPVLREGEQHQRPDHLKSNPKNPNYSWPGNGQCGNSPPERIEAIIRNYYAMITFIDEEVGRILDTLEAAGMADNTIICFTSDHGELLGDHNVLTKGPWPYECLHRVPLIIAGPGVPAGRKTDALCENVDIVPTLLDMLDETTPVGVQGRSQRSSLTGEGEPPRDSAVVSYAAHDVGIPLRMKTIHTARYAMAVFAGEKYGEFYDLEKDPDQFHNLYFDANYAEVRHDLHERLTHRLIEDEDPLPERKAQW